ncbi:hypothetical protein VTK73DRAFT_7874 [Phialemonium thermophilum]|uniref:Uncharacterized protein n=1 Tax=Phialemonium thermophilum TaxID=223376 RepID=A0ABR3XSF8_9PEZI
MQFSAVIISALAVAVAVVAAGPIAQRAQTGVCETQDNVCLVNGLYEQCEGISPCTADGNRCDIVPNAVGGSEVLCT